MRVRGIPQWANQGFLGLKLGDLVRGSMQWALISNYMIDFAWLLSACPDLLTAGKLVVVHGEKGQSAVEIATAVRMAGLADRAIIHAPPLPIQFGTHHSKAFILQYETGLRVIVHTANLIYPDCNNKTQGVWWQDFPPKDQHSPRSSTFEGELSQYLEQLRLPPSAARAAQSALTRHDFSHARARLVASVPGYHSGPRLHQWGHMRLRGCLSQEDFPSKFTGAPLAAQFSSLGSLDQKWLEGEFRASMSAGRCNAGQRLGPPSLPGPGGLQLVWPTVSEVQNSVEGWMAGRSIPGPSKNVGKPFLQEYWHRWGGHPCGRQRAMPHIKSYVRYERGGRELAWFMLASHNLSKAAWGVLQKGGTQLMVRSYELGVLLLPSLEAAYRSSRWRAFSCTPTGRTSHPAPPQPQPQPPPPQPQVAMAAAQRLLLGLWHGPGTSPKQRDTPPQNPPSPFPSRCPTPSHPHPMTGRQDKVEAQGRGWGTPPGLWIPSGLGWTAGGAASQPPTGSSMGCWRRWSGGRCGKGHPH